MSLSKISLLMLVLATIPASQPVRGQVPDTDIWLADIKGFGESLSFSTPVNVTNRPGYDNQPAFLWRWLGCNWGPPSTSGFLFTSADSTGATDIFRWDPRTRASHRLTHTTESEYSATPYGRENYLKPVGFYCVRVEADSTQRLWKFDIDGSNPRLVIADVDSVGYFAWIDGNRIAAFVLGNEKRKEPHTLRVIDVGAQTETIVARDVGRAIHLIPRTYDISFTVHVEDDTYRFFILKDGRSMGEPLIDAVTTGQDAAWWEETMLMSAGPAIYAATPGAKDGRRWRQVADFSNAGIAVITRLVVSPDLDLIAFVATTSKP